jgi:hypothetical protein
MAALLAALVVALLLLVAVQLGSGGASPTPSTVAASPTSTPQQSERTPSPSPSASTSAGASADPDELAAAVREITAQVAPIRGLEPREEVATRFLTPVEFRERVEEEFREDNSPEYLEASNRLYRRLGLIPADARLEDLTLELLEASVVGVYFPDEREMAVVGDVTTVGPLERFTLAHEIDHALQDQHYDLDRTLGIDSAASETDRTLARQALIEGDATQLMFEWATAHLTPAELLEIGTSGVDPEEQEVLARMPPILQRQLTFPYLDGQQFIAAVAGSGGWEAVDEAWAAPPESTEHILHPDAYLAGEAPLDVGLPDLANALGTGWERTLEDTLGELQTQVWLQGVGPNGAAIEGAAGWGGDRIETWEGPDDAWAMAWQTAWDSPADASEFVAAASRATETLEDPFTIISSEGGETAVLIFASDGTTLDRLAAVFDSI